MPDSLELEWKPEAYRAELRLHCYRMLGSYHEAEDLVQETFLRAWRNRTRFEGRTSLRNWLYKIATNACLNTLAARKTARRLLPDVLDLPSDRMPAREPDTDIEWLEPYPDSALEQIADRASGQNEIYELRESVRLAFIAAIHTLPPRQRAVLLLRDVLGWSAHEASETLETSVASINSALQRARAALPAPRPPLDSDEQSRSLLEQYMAAWERCDVDAFVAVISEEATFTMPPWRQWYRGRRDVAHFFARAASGGQGPFRLQPTRANMQPAFAFHNPGGFHSVQVVDISGGAIRAMVSFVGAEWADAFSL